MRVFRDEYGLTGCGISVAIFAFIALALVAVIGAGVAWTLLVSEPSCYRVWTDFSPEWSFFGGCTVEYEGARYPSQVLMKVLRVEL